MSLISLILDQMQLQAAGGPHHPGAAAAAVRMSLTLSTALSAANTSMAAMTSLRLVMMSLKGEGHDQGTISLGAATISLGLQRLSP